MIEWVMLILEYAIGDIRPRVMIPSDNLAIAVEYHHHNPNLNSILRILDIAIGYGDLARTRYMDAPWAHRLSDTLEHIRLCDNSAYKSSINYVPMSINEWCRLEDSPVTIPTALAEMRRVLMIHTLKDNVDIRLDEYVNEYYTMILLSLIKASR